VAAVRQGEPAALVAVPGVGRKTAERILVELGDKIERLAGVEVADEGDGAQAAARSALENLGYTRAQAEAAVRAAAAELPRAAGLEKLIREALRAAAR
jgi:Holliday junction DNA helicase RuvA